MLEMLPRGVEVVGDEGAAGADVVRAGRQHEVVDGKLAAPVEQVGKAALALRTSEDIGLFDPDPGQLAPLRAQRVEFVGDGKLAGEQRLARCEPFVAGNDRVLHDRSPSVWVADRQWRRDRPGARPSQGDRWNRLISRYIRGMPPSGRHRRHAGPHHVMRPGARCQPGHHREARRGGERQPAGHAAALPARGIRPGCHRIRCHFRASGRLWRGFRPVAGEHGLRRGGASGRELQV